MKYDTCSVRSQRSAGSLKVAAKMEWVTVLVKWGTRVNVIAGEKYYCRCVRLRYSRR
jgi:hypothetical protein